MKPDICIGIDPGVNTGVAIYRPSDRKLLFVSSMKAVEAESIVRSPGAVIGYPIHSLHVYVEDTRNLRLPSRLQQRDAFKGLGSVHRDMGRWHEFLEYHAIEHTMRGLAPKPFREGNDEWFKKLTGWDKRTNEHGRAAAGLVWGL